MPRKIDKAIIQKDADNSKYNRINQIYNMLKNNSEGMTISELANTLDVSTKTIQRDLHEVLINFGAIKEGRTWKINPKLAQDGLNKDEKLILGILDELAKGAGKIFYNKAHSLLEQISQQIDNSVFTQISAEYLEDKSLEIFSSLETAVKEKKEITFKYNNHDFHIKPLKLAFFEGFWYLLAFHIAGKNKEIFKKYHLKSISNIKILDKTFEVPQIVEDRLKNANTVWFNLDEQYSVRLFIDKDIRKYFERKPLLTQTILGIDSDGSMEIEIKISNNMEIIPLILYYVPYIKVLEPQSLADEVKSRIEEYYKEI